MGWRRRTTTREAEGGTRLRTECEIRYDEEEEETTAKEKRFMKQGGCARKRRWRTQRQHQRLRVVHAACCDWAAELGKSALGRRWRWMPRTLAFSRRSMTTSFHARSWQTRVRWLSTAVAVAVSLCDTVFPTHFLHHSCGGS